MARRLFHFAFAFSLSSARGRSFLLAARLSVPACSFTELVSRLSAALMNGHDLPAAIRFEKPLVLFWRPTYPRHHAVIF